MADLQTILREANGIHQDDGRDRVPPGKVWDMIDIIPRILGQAVRGRGAWKYQSDALATAPTGMLYAPYAAGAQLIVVLASGLVRKANLSSIGSSAIGTSGPTIQNPVFHRDRVIVPRSDNTAASFISSAGAVTAAPASALTGRFATVFKDRLVLARSTAKPTTVAFSKPGDPTLAWDSLSEIATSLPLTGIAAQRNQIICLHAGSVERIRGTTPPDSTLSDPTGDMILEPLFDRAGCFDARSIALWNENVIFADERGVHITDGAIVRNMAAQGGIESLWRYVFGGDPARGAAVSLAGVVWRDIYLVTIRNTSGAPVTFGCFIPTRQWFRVSNIDAACWAYSVGEGERIWAGDVGALRVADISPIFAPDRTVLQQDADGANVLPVIESGWLRLGKGEESLKRVKFVYVSYETGVAPSDATGIVEVSRLHGPNDNDHYHLIDSLPHSDDYRRRRLRAGLGSYGLGVKLEVVQPVKDFRLHDVAVDAYAEEEQKVGVL